MSHPRPLSLLNPPQLNKRMLKHHAILTYEEVDVKVVTSALGGASIHVAVLVCSNSLHRLSYTGSVLLKTSTTCNTILSVSSQSQRWDRRFEFHSGLPCVVTTGDPLCRCHVRPCSRTAVTMHCTHIKKFKFEEESFT